MQNNINKPIIGNVVIQVINSNPNGDADTGEPRRLGGKYGWISNQSIKRKIRDYVLNYKEDLNLANPEKFNIFESYGKGFGDEIQSESGENLKKFFEYCKTHSEEEIYDRYFDLRLFGCTILEKNTAEKDKDGKIEKGKVKRLTNGGVVTFTEAMSLHPVQVEIASLSRKAPTEVEKNQGMAPAAKKFVPYGIYYCTFYIDPHRAKVMRTTQEDIKVLLENLGQAISVSKSDTRKFVEPIQILAYEHDSAKINPFHMYNQMKPICEVQDKDGIVLCEQDVKTTLADPKNIVDVNGNPVKVYDMMNEETFEFRS